MKQTKATIPSWNLGEAYQPRMPKRLYIHPAGRRASQAWYSLGATVVSVATGTVLRSWSVSIPAILKEQSRKAEDQVWANAGLGKSARMERRKEGKTKSEGSFKVRSRKASSYVLKEKPRKKGKYDQKLGSHSLCSARSNLRLANLFHALLMRFAGDGIQVEAIMAMLHQNAISLVIHNVICP
jgi:hypothetical protein